MKLSTRLGIRPMDDAGNRAGQAGRRIAARRFGVTW
jgi:hypothetical protein